MKIKKLKANDWFNVSSEEYKNSYKLLGECEPKIYMAEHFNKLIEFNAETDVEKIDGFQLYLLQGGRDWD